MDLRLYASIFLVNDHDEILLVQEGKEKKYKLWNLPGGHIEQGEEYITAAVRETQEETGLIANPSHLLHIFNGQNLDSLHFIYLAREYTGSIAITDPHILDVKWFPLTEVQSMSTALLHPGKFHVTCGAYTAGDFAPLDILSRHVPLI